MCDFLQRFTDQRPAVGAYAQVLQPPVSICDITYWLNYLAQQKQVQGGKKIGAINTAGSFIFSETFICFTTLSTSNLIF